MALQIKPHYVFFFLLSLLEVFIFSIDSLFRSNRIIPSGIIETIFLYVAIAAFIYINLFIYWTGVPGSRIYKKKIEIE